MGSVVVEVGRAVVIRSSISEAPRAVEERMSGLSQRKCRKMIVRRSLTFSSDESSPRSKLDAEQGSVRASASEDNRGSRGGGGVRGGGDR